MTQAQVVTHLSDAVGITRQQAEAALDELSNLMISELKLEATIRLAGLGLFRNHRNYADIFGEAVGGC